MMALTKEFGLVGGDGIEQGAFVLVQAALFEQPFAVVAHGCEPDPSHVPPHPAFKMQVAAMREARLLAAELRITREAVADPSEGKGDGWDSDLLA